MGYIGYFPQHKTNKHLSVVIGDGSTPVDMTGGGFTTTMDTGDSTIYKPAKYSKATAEFRTGDYMMDTYAAGAQDIPVKLMDGNAVLWTGYATPNVYNMDFVRDRENIQIEAVDALSTLRYFNYEKTGDTVISFLQLINKCIAKANAYKAFYFTANVQLSKDSDAPAIEKLCISEQLFFGSKSSGDENNDIWSYRDVLEALCQWLGVTAVAIGESVYFIDYDAIAAAYKAGTGASYYRYDVGGTTATLVTVGGIKEIVSDDFGAASSAISMDNVYNKVTVKDDFETFEDILPELFNDDDLTNITTGSSTSWNIKTDTKLGIILDPSDYASASLSVSNLGGNIEATIDWAKTGRKQSANYFVAHKYYTSSRVTTYMYKMGSSLPGKVTYPSTLGFSALAADTYYGCVLMREQVQSVSDDLIDVMKAQSTEDFVKTSSQEIAMLSFIDTIMFVLRGFENPFWYAGGDDWTNTSKCPGLSAYDRQHGSYPMFETVLNPSDASKAFGGDNAYLIITGDIVLGLNQNDPYNKTAYTLDTKYYKSTVPFLHTYIWCRLQWGGYYWNGDKWQTTACDFKLYFGQMKNQKAYDVVYKSQPIRNTVKWWYGLDKEGYCIPVSKSAGLDGSLMSGNVTFTMYSPMQQYDDAYHVSKQQDMRSFYIFLKNLKIQAAIGDPTYSGKNDKDTAYTNVISAGSVTDLDEVSMKVCTDDGKQPNYSAVIIKNGSALTYADKTFNRACYGGESAWESSDADGLDGSNGLRQEEHMVYKITNQYATPSVVLSLPLRADNSLLNAYHYHVDVVKDKVFVADQINTDYRNYISTVKIVEKK